MRKGVRCYPLLRYTGKKKWLKEQLSGLFIKKSLNLQAEEYKYSMVHGGKIWKWGKNTIFIPPLIFLQVFLSQVGKKLDQGGKYYIVSPQAHIQEAV